MAIGMIGGIRRRTWITALLEIVLLLAFALWSSVLWNPPREAAAPAGVAAGLAR
jgi:hypothetical protein